MKTISFYFFYIFSMKQMRKMNVQKVNKFVNKWRAGSIDKYVDRQIDRQIDIKISGQIQIITYYPGVWKGVNT